MKALFVRKQQLAPRVWEFFFRPESQLDYQAGQYVHIGLPDLRDARSSERTFTLTSTPDETALSFAVKFPEPHSAYKARLLELIEADAVTVSQAMGDLVLPRDSGRPLVFVAGGLGIASFVGMIKHLAATNENRPLTLLYGHKPGESLYADSISALAATNYHEFVSPHRIEIGDVLQDDVRTLYFISGSEPFTMGFRNQLLERGVAATNIVYDYFDGYQPADL